MQQDAELVKEDQRAELIPRTTPYILHGDEKALAAALPENLKLIPQK